MRICGACQTRFVGETWRCPSCGATPASRDGYLELSAALDHGEGGFGADAFSELFELEAGHFWFHARNRLLVWAIQKYFPDARRMLEVGCGTGFVLSHLERAFPDRELSGGEAYAEALRFAATRVQRSALYLMDVRSLPFEQEFDLVGAFDVLEHVTEDEQALAQLHRATCHGGGLVLTVPQHPWLWSSADETAHHVRRYTRAGLRAKVQRAGFEVVRTTSFVTALLPPMIASRLLRKREPAAKSVEREFALDPALDRAFRQILRLERRFIRAGVSLPVGGSLLLVARKC